MTQPRARAGAQMLAWLHPPCMCCRSPRHPPCGPPSTILPSSGTACHCDRSLDACIPSSLNPPLDICTNGKAADSSCHACPRTAEDMSSSHSDFSNVCFLSTGVCSPDGMIRSVQSCPSASMLADLKDCLDFCSNSWVALFCRQGGTAVLLQVGNEPSASGYWLL